MKKKGFISFSGGETSAFMLWWLLQNKSDEYDFIILFANTGRENQQTLDFIKECSDLFNCKIIFLEAVIRFKVRAYGKSKIFTSFEEKEKYLLSFTEDEKSKIEFHKRIKDKKTGLLFDNYRMCIDEEDCGTTHKIVDYNTCTKNQDWKIRNDTPYEMMVKKFGLANIVNRFSTRELKERPMYSYLKSIGWKKGEFDVFIGIRIDEIDRMSKNRDTERIIYPLIKWKPMSKNHINFWWSLQKFRLKLSGWAGNCITCYKKSLNKLAQIMLDDEWKFEFDEYLENSYGQYIPRRRLLHIFFFGGELPELPIRIFRENNSVQDLKILSTELKKETKDDSIHESIQLDLFQEEESCEVFSQCGINN